MLAVIDEPKLLSPDDRALTSAGGIPTAFVRENKNRALRGPEARALGEADTKIPHIRAIEIQGRKAVFISREDLSTALVGEPVDGVNGYTPATAAQLMASMLIFSAGGG